jgi:hypothetical protein
MLFVPFYHIKISRVAGGIPPSLFVRLVLMVSPGTIDLDNCKKKMTLKCNVRSHRGNDTSKRLKVFLFFFIHVYVLPLNIKLANVEGLGSH